MPSQKNKKRPVFIIAEAGSNWKVGSSAADWKRARALVDTAKEAGADAVKFQTLRASSVYVPNAGVSAYLSKQGIRESIVGLFERLSMPYEMIPKLAAYCRKQKMEFMSSFFSADDFKIVNPWVWRHKIASYEITHPRLLELAAQSGKPLILSTGAAMLNDIDWAIRYYRQKGGKEITLMQCTAKYPAPLEALHLQVIPEFLKRYRIPVGFSDHSIDPVVGAVTAVALGAGVIEKHFTLSRKLKGPDHAFAVEPGELRQMVQSIRGCEKALGDAHKRVLDVERELSLCAQRAVQAIRDIRKGDILREGKNVAILRAGSRKKGMHPRWIFRAEGKKAKKQVALGDGIQLSNF